MHGTPAKPVPTKAFLQPQLPCARPPSQASADQGFSTASPQGSCHVHGGTPAKAAAVCTAPHAETRPPPPISPFLLAQNLSSKRIAPSDNMQPKFHEYSHHQWLKEGKLASKQLFNRNYKVSAYKCSRTVPSKGIPYTELATASLYMAVNETNHSQMHLTRTLVVVNKIHTFK